VSLRDEGVVGRPRVRLTVMNFSLLILL
jgi:hypothetical protein